MIPPMTTPFTARGEIDERALRAQARFLLEAGVHGLAVGGSTGEGQTLTSNESRRLVRAAVEPAEGRVPIIAGSIVDATGPGTRQAIERGKAVADLGVAAIRKALARFG